MAALALLVVGGMALVNAVTGEPDQKGPSGVASPSAEDGGKTSPSSNEKSTPASDVPLVISVTGQPTTVVVRVADTQGEVLTNGTLQTGVTLKYDQAPLQVVAGNGGSLKVVIYGEVQPEKPAGQRGQWFVKAKS
ncbi:RodZ domain-containing protein [Actinomadura sp. BRA 177]|uniref:RodZ domain-containing protein n=1 Tax=Actinomadura sp. BRA 177 TaxID=2745202 RepID=UPI002815A8E6|nr:RodZ domain-containing protein [Actinomadura sp. BRA 177]